MKDVPRRQLLRLAAGCSVLGLGGLLTARSASGQSPREIELEIRRFRFTPSEITLRVNEPVVLLVRSIDFLHGIHVPDLKVRADLPAGLVTRVALLPTTVGTIDFLCDNFCGEGHEGLAGRFIVVDGPIAAGSR
jgi:cytochrome c oxidase subunit 2